MSGFSEENTSMTFEEIAQEMRCSRGAVWGAYKNAMRKIRRDPDALKDLQELVQFKSKRLIERSL